MLELLRLPDIGVEVAVDLRRIRQHRGQLEDVAVDLELDPRHVVEDVPVAALEADRVVHGEVDVVDAQGRVLVGKAVDVRGQSTLET